ncbi:unnamed protein product [Closterium sp. NIES-54]
MKYHIDDTVELEKARLVVKGFTQVYGADYDETYSPVSSYVTLRIFLSIIAVLDFNLMKLDMKNAFLQSKVYWVLYMNQPDYFNDGTGRVCKLLKSLYRLKHSLLLWYRALDGMLLGAGWKKSQVDTALYFKVGDDGVVCWVLVYVDDLLAASNSTEMLKELLEATFELRKISPVQKYLGLEIVRDRPARKLWLHQQGYADKLPGVAGGAAGPGGAGAGGTGAVEGPAGVGAAGGAGVAGPGGAHTGGTGAAGAGGVAGVGAAGAGDPGAKGTGAVFAVSRGAVRPRPYYVPLLQQFLRLPPSTC